MYFQYVSRRYTSVLTNHFTCTTYHDDSVAIVLFPMVSSDTRIVERIYLLSFFTNDVSSSV